MSFENRYMIIGRLTTLTPLHIGNGDVITHPELKNESTKELIQITSVNTNDNGIPYIPGSTLKGNLRSWAKKAGLTNVDSLFGSDDVTKDSAVGGKVEFYDTLVADDIPLVFAENERPPYWREKRFTGIIASTTIDRRTRTASDERLFHREYIPEGVSFKLMITGQDITDEEILELLCTLDGFNSRNVKLGSSTGDGWGVLQWELTDLKRIIKNEVANWIDNNLTKVGYEALESLPSDEQKKINEQVAVMTPSDSANSAVSFKIMLNFNSHFLVNDTSRTGSMDDGKPDHFPFRDAKGHVVLPASSFRGALRSQAEKILRTIHGEHAACYPDSKGQRKACKAVYEINDLIHLCPICKLFGASGWKSPLKISNFKTSSPVSEDELKTQEFVAIDRFTGGGAKGAKFNAKAMYMPILNGTLSIDLKALERSNVGGWALGLLALTFRDIIEGDVRFGFGAAKGYGSANAKIITTHLPLWDKCPDIFKADLSKDEYQLDAFNELSSDSLKTILEIWVIELNELELQATEKGTII